jgi:chromosomal replication initiator protein
VDKGVRVREAAVPQAVWQQSLDRLKGRLSATEIGCWVQAIHPVSIHERRLYGEVPSVLHLEQIRARLAPEIDGVLEELLGPGAELVLSVNKDRAHHGTEGAREEDSRPSAYSFDSFVVGESNALAHATACEVAEHPGAAYNPLFLFGGVGLGKTHLASAVAKALGRGRPRRVSLVSAEALANELIRAIFGGGIDALRGRLRQLDALIVDDIQFLAGKERMQEEFFHTFNSLKGAGRQIVLASDQAPGAIANLEERLRSRFESGLIAEIRPPDPSLRVAILEHKAKFLRFELPLEVTHWVAEKVVSSVRELEGALHRLVAACRCSKRTLDLSLAKEVLRPLLRPAPVRTVEQVQRIVAERFHVTPGDLIRRGGTGSLRMPRQVAMYLARKRTKATFAEIAAGFGGRDHSTVVHAVKQVEARRLADFEFATLVDGLAEKLAAGSAIADSVR